MSGYWDAVDRAALGAPAMAEPLPHPAFEPEMRDDGGFDVVESETWASQPGAPAPAATPAVAAVAAEPVAIERREDVRSSAEPAPIRAIATTTVPRAVDEPTPRAPIETLAAPEPAPSPPLTVVEAQLTERVERIERLTTSIERTIATAPEPVEPTPPAPILAQQIEAQAASARAPAPEPATAVPAQPIQRAAEIIVAPVSAPEAQAPVAPLVIEIGRIEVRIETPTTSAPPATPRRRESAAPSLNEFLTRRGAGR